MQQRDARSSQHVTERGVAIGSEYCDELRVSAQEARVAARILLREDQTSELAQPLLCLCRASSGRSGARAKPVEDERHCGAPARCGVKNNVTLAGYSVNSHEPRPAENSGPRCLSNHNIRHAEHIRRASGGTRRGRRLSILPVPHARRLAPRRWQGWLTGTGYRAPAARRRRAQRRGRRSRYR